VSADQGDQHLAIVIIIVVIVICTVQNESIAEIQKNTKQQYAVHKDTVKYINKTRDASIRQWPIIARPIGV